MIPREVPPADDYYMGLAFWARTRSKDPSTNVGAIIVSKENIPLGSGYNGPPRQIDDQKVDWSRPAKYPNIIHAEKNAIRYSHCQDLTGSTLYVTGRPCSPCMLDIVTEGISIVIYYVCPADDASMLNDDEDWTKARTLAKLGQVQLVEFRSELGGNLNWMQTEMKIMESFGLFN